MTADTMNTASQQLNMADDVNPTKDNELSAYNRKSKKEALMEMIAQEMVNSMLGNDDTEVADEEDDVLLKEFQEKLARRARRKAKRRASMKSSKKKEKKRESSTNPASPALADMYYAQMAGESAPVHDLREYELKIKDHEDNDDDSFAGGCLDDLVSPSHRSSVSSRSRSSDKTGSSSASYSSGSTGSGMDVDEIRKFVMSNIPQAVRDQIPQEAWGEIFQGSTGGSQASSKRSMGSKSRSRKSKSGAAPIDAIVVDGATIPKQKQPKDDDSVLSEITGVFSTAFPDGKRVESKLEKMIHEEPGTLADHESPSLIASEAPGEGSVRTEQDSYHMSIMGRSSVSAVPTPVASDVKKVAFSYVTVRFYERILSDNPSVQSGPAIGIGWRFKRGGNFEVDEFEQGRGMQRKSDELVLPRPVREKMLKDAGYTQKEIADMVRNILKAKNQRIQTVNNLNAQGVEEAVENAKKRVGRLLSFGKNKDILE